jgi:hypothetical protein
MKTIGKWSIVLGCSCLFATTLYAATATFQTGDFTPGEWTSVFSGTGTASAATETAGGHQGAYRSITLTMLTTVFGNHEYAAQLWEVAQFTPSIQGAISSVSLSYDITLVSSTYKGYAIKGISLRQYGVSYYFSGVGSDAKPPTWETVAWTDIVPLFPQVNWTNGATITFGLAGDLWNSDVPHTMNTGYDNFRVDVTYQAVPEPSTFALLAVAFALQTVRHLREREGKSWVSETPPPSREGPGDGA